ncbi:MAG: GNAT family N-acetyltransferase [Clostridiales bacterium]|nr:GNAT family N-acetyltransferase [Clostridiales bacterium]
MDIFCKQCGLEALQPLTELSRKTFQETFGAQNTPADMQAYLDNAFHPDKLRAQLLNQNSSFYLLYTGGVPAGYLKLNRGPAQSDINDEAALEVERIYVARKWQGRGLGRRLMDKAVEIARAEHKTYIWLGVWEKNKKALAFYERQGFIRTGAHTFSVGDSKQTDYIMRLGL